MKETKASIILENNFATLEFSKKDATLESVLFKSGRCLQGGRLVLGNHLYKRGSEAL